MRKALLAATLLLISSSGANAITISAGGGAWRENPDGWIEYTSDNIHGTGVSSKTHIDVDDDLNLDTETKGEGWFKIKGIPILPDVKVQYTAMKFTGSGVVNTSFTFGNITVPTKSYVDSKLRANQVDITLTYGVPFIGTATAGKFRANWGFNVKVIDGYARVKYYNPTTGERGEDSKSATIPVPMAHLDFEVRPVNLVGIEASGNFIGYGGSKFYEYTVEGKVYPIKHLFVGVGYRYQRLKIDDISDVSSDLKVKGMFAEAGFRF